MRVQLHVTRFRCSLGLLYKYHTHAQDKYTPNNRIQAMAFKLTYWAAPASFLAAVLVLQLLPTVPSETSKLDAWIVSNVKQYQDVSEDSKSLDEALSEAEANVKVIKVNKDGSGDFDTVTEAVKSVPSGNTGRVIIRIGGGEYKEMVKVDKSKPFITFYGESGDMPRISYDGTAKEYGTWDCATVVVESNYFMAVNIAFVVRFYFPLELCVTCLLCFTLCWVRNIS
jgi:hypothetical protein